MSLVKVNIRGRKYQASADILRKSSYFTEVLDADPECTEIKLDRDPQFFGPLLAFWRKGRFSVEVSELDGASKVQLFEDIMFHKIKELERFILADITYEEQKDIEKANRGKERVEPPVADTVVAADPIVQPNGQGCFLCGTMDHAEENCKHNPANRAG